MKYMLKIFLISSFLNNLTPSYTQEKLFGISEYGGLYNGGTIYSQDVKNGNVEVLHSFTSGRLELPYNIHMVEGENGLLYGIIGSTIFEYNPIINEYKPIFIFPLNLTIVNTDLLYIKGDLYGVSDGFNRSKGDLFKFNIASKTLTNISDEFNSLLSRDLTGTLVKVSDTIILSMYGNNRETGLVLIDITKNKFTRVGYFNEGSTVKSMGSNLIEFKNGNYFGITSKGKAFSYNSIKEEFKVHTDGDFKNFNLTESYLTKTEENNVFALTKISSKNKFGSIVKINVLTEAISELVVFDSTSTGSYPSGPLVDKGNGIYIGLLMKGGINNSGTLLEYNSATNLIEKISPFSALTTGKFPFGSIVITKNKEIYGLVSGYFETKINYPVKIFKYNIDDNLIQVVKTTNEKEYGHKPIQIHLNKSGNIFGICQEGGTYGKGLIFNFDLQKKEFKVIFNFKDSLTGNYPKNGFLLYEDKYIFGIVANSYSNYSDILYKFDLEKLEYKVLERFNKSSYCLTLSNDNKLMGLSELINNAGYKNLFQYDIKKDTLYNRFQAFFPADPEGIFQYNDSLFYILFPYYGNMKGEGSMAYFNSNTWEPKYLFNFDSEVMGGGGPCTNMVKTNEGIAIGAFNINNRIYEYKPLLNKINILVSVDNYDPNHKVNSLVPSKLFNGVFGTISLGGKWFEGSIFKYNYTFNWFEKTYDFKRSINSPSNPIGNLLSFNYSKTDVSNQLKEQKINYISSTLINTSLKLKNIEKIKDIKIFNLNGFLLFHSNSINNENLDLSFFESGIYIIKINDLHTERILVIK